MFNGTVSWRFQKKIYTYVLIQHTDMGEQNIENVVPSEVPKLLVDASDLALNPI